MPSTVDPETEARIVDLARRLGFFGPDLTERVLEMALDALEAKTQSQAGKVTAAETATELQELEKLSAVGRRWREENTDQYDENNPPSIAWQEELYDENGLPA